MSIFDSLRYAHKVEFVRIPEIELSNKNCFKQLLLSMKIIPIKNLTKYLSLVICIAFFSSSLQGQIEFEILSGDAQICAGDSTLLSIDASVDSVQWSPTSGVSMPNSLATFVAPTQSTTYFATLFSGSETTNVRFQVDVFSAPNLGNDIVVCGGSDIEIDLNNVPLPTDYLLTSNGPLPISGNIRNIFTVSTSAANLGTFNLIASSNCEQTDTIQITVIAGTPAIIDGNFVDAVVCPGDAVSFIETPQGGQTYEWFANGISVSNTSVLNENPTVTTTYVLAATGAGCSVPTVDSVTVTVNAPPAISLPETLLACQNDFVTLGNNILQVGTEYSWSPSDNIVDPTALNAELFVVEDETYILTATNGCEIRDTVDVSLILNDIEIDMDTIFICKGESATISFTTNPPSDAVVWTDIDGVPLANVGSPFEVSPLDVVTFIGTVENNGCTHSDTVTIQVDSLPEFPEIELIELDMMPPICQGDTVLLQDNPVFPPNLYPDLTFQWFTGDTTMVPALPGQLDGFLTPDSLLQVLFLGQQSQVYNRLNINGACRSFSSIDVEVIPILQVEIVPVDLVCPGTAFAIMTELTDPSQTPPAPVDPNDLEEWDWMTSSGTIEPADEPFPTLTVGESDANVNVTAEYRGCPIMGDTIVEVIPTPFPIFPNDTEICPGQSVVLNSNPNPNTADFTYTWTTTNGTTPNELTGQENDPNPVVTPPGSATYTVTIFSAACNFTITEEVSIQVLDRPGTLAAPLMVGVCQDESVTLTLEGQGIDFGQNAVFTWTPTNGGEALPPGREVTFVPLQTTTYIIRVTNDCFQDEFVGEAIVTVQQRPAVTITCDPDLDDYSEGFEVDLIVEPNTPDVVYTWTSDNGGDFSANPAPTTVYSVTSQGIGLDEDTDLVTVLADLNGCTNSDTKIFNIMAANVMLPNIFTPGTTDNAVFRLRTNAPINITNMQIYDRWGNKVYDNDNAEQEWDGNIDGQPAPSDVYIVTVTYEIPGQDPITDSTDLTLLR